MKRFLALILLLVPGFALQAQTGRYLINRIDHEEETKLSNDATKMLNAQGGGIKHIITVQKAAKPDYTLLNQPAQGSSRSFSFVLQDSVVAAGEDEAPELSGTITNTSMFPIHVIFERTHIRADSNVIAGICLCSCYADNLDSLPDMAACTLDAGPPTWNFLYHPHTVFGHTLSQPDTIIDYVKLTAVGGDAGDTISFIVRGILMPASGVQTSQSQTALTPKIKAIYPSPLVQGSAIKVRVSSPVESSLSYSIFDALGRVVALGVTRQHIGLGDNTISIGSLDGLASGNYTLKFNFGEGSSDTHFFQVVR